MRLYLALMFSVGLLACEDEQESGPRGGEPSAAGATASTEPGAQAQAKGKAEAEASARPVVSSRVPTASELLGLGKVVDGRTPNLEPTRADGPNPLFSGAMIQPSKKYEKMKGAALPGVSPIVRHWGNQAEPGAAQATSEVLPTANDRNKVAPDVSGDKQKAAEPKRVRAEDLRKYPLVLYRLNRATGSVEVFERSFATKQAHRAAKQLALRQGYGPNKPAAKVVASLKAASEVRKKIVKAKACQFRAQWTSDTGVKLSRCFTSTAAVDAFMDAQRAARAKKAAAAKAAKQPKPAPKAAPAPPAQPSGLSSGFPANDRSLKPEPIGK